MELLSLGAEWHAEYALSSRDDAAATAATAATATGAATAATAATATGAASSAMAGSLSADVRLLQRLLEAHSWYQV
jgi:hypothetical protein